MGTKALLVAEKPGDFSPGFPFGGKMWQVRLKSGNTRLTCWVDKKVHLGNRVSLKKDAERFWDVLWVSQPHDEIPDSKWKVGGLR